MTKELDLTRVKTRDGQEVTEIKDYRHTKSTYCIVGVVGGELRTWARDGKYFAGSCREEPLALVEVPKTVERWVVVAYNERTGDAWAVSFSFNEVDAARKLAEIERAHATNLSIIYRVVKIQFDALP